MGKLHYRARHRAKPDLAHTLTGPYVCDALGSCDRFAVEGHLRACPACATEVAEFQATTAALAAHCAIAPPEALYRRVREKLGDTRQMRPLRRRPSFLSWLSLPHLGLRRCAADDKRQTTASQPIRAAPGTE